MTEWIPERIAIRPNSAEFNEDKEFKRLLDRFHKGHCLVTVATGELSDAEADRAGLVPTHAYAMLDIRQYKVGVWKIFFFSFHCHSKFAIFLFLSLSFQVCHISFLFIVSPHRPYFFLNCTFLNSLH